MLTSNEWKVVEKPLEVNFIYCNYYITENKMYIDLPTTIKKIKTYNKTYIMNVLCFVSFVLMVC